MNSVALKYHNFILRFEGLKGILFYVALSIELLIMVYERTDLPLSTPSYVFRLTFVLFLLVILLTRYTLRQYIVIGLSVILTFYCYRVTGNNDLLRVSVFVASCKDIDLQKTLKWILTVMGVGYLVIFMMSVLGVFGNVAVNAEYGRDVGEELRYVFGFGHPNTLHGAFFALAVLSIYVLKDADMVKKALAFGAFLVLNIVLFQFSDSRTGFYLSLLGILAGGLVAFCPKVRTYKASYLVGGAAVFLSVAISVLAAIISPHAGDEGSFYEKIDHMLTGRIWSLYNNTPAHKGSFETWTAFGDLNSGESYFDMGWIRLFYWYGIIPACVIIAVTGVLIYYIYKKQDIEALVMLSVISLYTIVEASFVSSYIGRNYMLPLAGVYLFNAIGSGGKVLEEK